MSFSAENPWIREREATICIWKVDQNRGYISNMAPSLFCDFMSYSDRQISEYVKMMKDCGFTGIQVTDMCSAWRPSGSWETVHDRLRTLAACLHENGMKFTVWCWAAEFTNHGWHDETVVYANAEEGKGAYDDPRVFAALDKYYDIYAELAPCADRVIAHFFDPGNIGDTPSILKFARLLFDKFRAKNPDIKIGIDTWGSPDNFPEELVRAGFDDIMLMELPFLPGWRSEGKRASFREGVKKLGCELGSWGWYTCEYEIDQRPFMCVNNRVIADVYRQTREQGDSVMVPSYWSEMDSYHVLNFFSMYAAGQLLTDPERSPDEILKESALLVAGEAHADELLYVLELIRDARSGDTWKTYWWQEGEYILDVADHEDILRRSEKAIGMLEALIEDGGEYNTVHLPVTVNQMYRLILPHLYQIKQYARFAIDFKKLTEMKKIGAGKAELQKAVDALPYEIPEYNCVIGLWGQPEARDAYEKVRTFCKENDLDVPDRGAVKFLMKRRIYDHLTVLQRGKKKQLFADPCFYEAGYAYGFDQTKELVEELCREGVFEQRESDGFVALTNWESFKFDFNI